MFPGLGIIACPGSYCPVSSPPGFVTGMHQRSDERTVWKKSLGACHIDHRLMVHSSWELWGLVSHYQPFRSPFLKMLAGLLQGQKVQEDETQHYAIKLWPVYLLVTVATVPACPTSALGLQSTWTGSFWGFVLQSQGLMIPTLTHTYTHIYINWLIFCSRYKI